VKDIHDVIKHAKFGDDRLRGSGVVAGQFSAFPIDSAGRPYNTLTLPCERVIWTNIIIVPWSPKKLQEHLTTKNKTNDSVSMSRRMRTWVRLSEIERAAEEQCVERSFEGDERWRRDD